MRKGSPGEIPLRYWLYLPLFVTLGLLERGAPPLWGFYLGLAALFLLLLRTPFLAAHEGRLHAVLGLALLGQLCLFVFRPFPLPGANRFALSALLLVLLAWAAFRVVGSRSRVPVTRAAVPRNLLAAPLYLLLGALLGALVFTFGPAQTDSSLLPTWWLALWLALMAVGEEVLFRGSLLRAAAELLGTRQAVLWSAGIYASFALPLAWPVVGFIFLLGVGFGWLALSARSVVGVSLAHVAVNLTLFIALPLWWPLWVAG